MRDNMRELYDLDEVIAEQNQLIIAEGGPVPPTDEEMAETAKYISEAKRKAKENAGAIIRLFSDKEKNQQMEM